MRQKRLDQNDPALIVQIHTAIMKSGVKKWNTDHVKAFFKTKVKNSLDNYAAIAILNRAMDLGGITMTKVDGINHYYKASNDVIDACLKRFLYGGKS